MRFEHKQRPNPSVRITRKRSNRISRYADSFPHKVHDAVQPRVISSNPISLSKKHRDKSASTHIESFCPYARLNYGNLSTDNVSAPGRSPLYEELRLKTTHERSIQKERQLSQLLIAALVAIAIVLFSAGLLWMQYSNSQAANRPQEIHSES